MTTTSSALIATLLFIFALPAWAFPPGCEILLETRYGRIIGVLAEKKVLTTDQLKSLAQSDKPFDPFEDEGRLLENLSFRQILRKALERQDTFDRWPETRKAIAIMAGIAVETQAQVDKVVTATDSVFNPKITAKVGISGTKSTFFNLNPKKNQIILMEIEANRSLPTIYNFGTGTKIPDFELEGQNHMIVRRNGEVWVVVRLNNKILVKKYPGEEVHYSMDADDRLTAEIYETPTGHLFLSSHSLKKGLLVLDVTEKDKGVELLVDPGVFSKLPVFHVSKKGVLMATATDNITKVYRYLSGQMIPLGEIPGSKDKVRTIVLTSDANGNPIVGEPIDHELGYRVTKLVNEEPDPIFHDPGLKVNGHGAVLEWNRMGNLILAISGSINSKTFYLINLSDKSFPKVEIPIPDIGRVRASWFKLPDGNEVIALSPFNAKAMVIHADDGTILKTFPATGGLKTGPQWAKMSDGRILLALDNGTDVQVYDVWRKDSARTAK